MRAHEPIDNGEERLVPPTRVEAPLTMMLAAQMARNRLAAEANERSAVGLSGLGNIGSNGSPGHRRGSNRDSRHCWSAAL